jgi:hypothetical protein
MPLPRSRGQQFKHIFTGIAQALRMDTTAPDLDEPRKPTSRGAWKALVTFQPPPGTPEAKDGT